MNSSRAIDVYVVTFRTTIAGIDGIRALRATLKFALRRFGLRAIDAYEHSTARASRRHPALTAGAAHSRREDTEMDASRFAGSGFLSLDDVKGGPITAEIADVTEGGYKKLVLTFTNGLKFSLNVTNTTEMIKAFGAETDLWLGERVELHEGEAPYQDKMVPSVRLTPLMRETGAKKRPPPPKPKSKNFRGGDMDDEIVF